MTDFADIALPFDRFLRRLHQQLPARAEKAGIAFVPPPTGLVLFVLAEVDPAPMPMQELARALARDKSQITRMVRDLEGKGLVVRKPDPDDARVSLLALTTDGIALLTRMEEVRASLLADLLSPLDEAERTALAAILNKL